VPVFSYKAIDSQGHETTEEITMPSRKDVIDQLISRKLSPISVEEQNPSTGHSSSRRFSRPGRVSKSDVDAFTRELSKLLSAGVPLSRSINILSREAASEAAKKQWSDIRDSLSDGSTLADSIARFPQSFSDVYVAMVRAGETGGFLDQVLNQIADFRAREQRLIGTVKTAMIYPVILAVLGTAILAFLMTYFIPKFVPIFEEFGGSLPFLTLIIVGASDIVKQYGLIILIAVIMTIIGLRRALALEEGRRVFERIVLALPVIGRIVANFALVRFSRMLGTLTGAGVPLVTALKVSNESIGNQTLSDTVNQAIKKVQNGAALASSMAVCPKLFPPSVIEMISVSEESGGVDQGLVHIASSYEETLDRELSALVAMVEPALLFLMAIAVAVIILGMLLPIFSLQELIH